MNGVSTFFTGTGLRASVSVTFILILAFVVTGFLSSFYKRERLNQGRIHYEAGLKLAAKGQPRDAVAEYRRALLFSPDDREYRLSFAEALVNLNQLDEAETHLQELAAEDPASGMINLMLARVAERRGQVSQAIVYYQRAVDGYWPLTDSATRRQARWSLIQIFEMQNRHDEAVAGLMQLYAVVPDDQEQKAKIGFQLLKYGSVSNAVEVFRDLVRDHPRYVEAHHGLGEAYFDSGEYVSARQEFQRAMRIDSRDRENLQMLALVNAVINVDPSFGSLTAAERLRRSRNLLHRVIGHLEDCLASHSGAAAGTQQQQSAAVKDPLQQQLAAADKLLAARPMRNSDLNLELQDMAQQLWKSRQEFCAQKPVTDQVLETVLARIARD